MWCICGVFGFVDGAGEMLLMLLIRILGLPETVPVVAVAISLAKDVDVVVTTGGRRWPW